MRPWKDLSMKERGAFIRVGVKNGITSVDGIRDAYNKFACGGHKFDDGGPKENEEKTDAIQSGVDLREYDEKYQPREMVGDLALARQTPHEEGLQIVSPEFDLLTLGRSIYNMPRYIGLTKNAESIFTGRGKYFRQVSRADKAIEDAKNSGVIRVRYSPGYMEERTHGKFRLEKSFTSPMFERGRRFYPHWDNADVIVGTSGNKGLGWIYGSKGGSHARVDKGGRRLFLYDGQSAEAPSQYFRFYRSYGPAYFDVTDGGMTLPITGIDFLRDRVNKKSKGGKLFNKFQDGGTKLSNGEFNSILRRQAEVNAKYWGVSPAEAYRHMLNDPTYDYRGFYEANPNAQNNPETHWPDTYKTYLHPTFSNESKYSGKIVFPYNPTGAVGGRWEGDEYIPNDEYHRRSWEEEKVRMNQRAKGGRLANIFDGTTQDTQQMQTKWYPEGWPWFARDMYDDMTQAPVIDRIEGTDRYVGYPGNENEEGILYNGMGILQEATITPESEHQYYKDPSWILSYTPDIDDVYSYYSGQYEDNDKFGFDPKMVDYSNVSEEDFKNSTNPILLSKDMHMLLDHGKKSKAYYTYKMLDAVAEQYSKAGVPLIYMLGHPNKETTWGNPTIDASRNKLTGGRENIKKTVQLHWYLDHKDPNHFDMTPSNMLSYSNPYKAALNYVKDNHPLDKAKNFDDYINRRKLQEEGLINGYGYARKLASERSSDNNPFYNIALEFSTGRYNNNQSDYYKLVEDLGRDMLSQPDVQEWIKNQHYYNSDPEVIEQEFQNYKKNVLHK